MQNDTRDAVAWTLDGAIGALRRGAIAAQVNLSRPQLGFHELRLVGAPVEGHLLSVSPCDLRDWPARVSDAYVRGQDLVAAYEAAVDWPYEPRIYWSADVIDSSSETMAALSLLVSIQTNLLDTHPRVDVGSRLQAEEMLRVSPAGDEDVHVESLPDGEHAFFPATTASCVLWRLADRPISYVEMVPASDFRRLVVHSHRNGQCESRWQLFAEFLEKGVIRRARVHMAFLPRENDVERAADLCRAIENRPLPLTT